MHIFCIITDLFSCCVCVPVVPGLPSTPATQLLEQQALEFEAADIAASTQQEYAAHWKYWVRFCIVFGLASVCFAPSERAVIWYASWLSRSCNPRVICTYLSGLRHQFIALGVLTAATWCSWVHLPRVLKGIKRLKSVPVVQKLAITPEMLVAMLPFIAPTPRAVCTWCAILVCFYSFLRKAHVCVGGSSLLVPHLLLLRKHVVIDPIQYAVYITVHFSKTAQYNTGPHVIVLKGVRGGLLDPVFWLQHYFSLVPAAPDAPCFVIPDSSGSLQPLQ